MADGNTEYRRTREFSPENIAAIAATCHRWRDREGTYEDVKEFCNAASIERVREFDYVLTPGEGMWVCRTMRMILISMIGSRS